MEKNYINNRQKKRETALAKRKRKKFKSPSLRGMVHIKGKTSMVPNRKLRSEEEVEAWKQEMIEKFGL